MAQAWKMSRHLPGGVGMSTRRGEKVEALGGTLLVGLMDKDEQPGCLAMVLTLPPASSGWLVKTQMAKPCPQSF